MGTQQDVAKVVKALDQILKVVDDSRKTGLRPTLGDEMQTIITIPDLFDLDRLQESVIYLTSFYGLDK